MKGSIKGCGLDLCVIAVVTACFARSYLPLDAFDLDVLRVDLVPHVQRHALQVPHDAANMSQVLLHLVLSGVVGHPEIHHSRVCVCVCVAEQGDGCSGSDLRMYPPLMIIISRSSTTRDGGG